MEHKLTSRFYELKEEYAGLNNEKLQYLVTVTTFVGDKRTIVSHIFEEQWQARLFLINQIS